MRLFWIVIRILLAIALITEGLSNISQPSNVLVALGVFEVVLALVLMYQPAKIFIKQL